MTLKDRTEIPLWCGTPPAGESDPEQIPAITPFAPLVWKTNHRALVIFPGGARYHDHPWGAEALRWVDKLL